MQNVRKRIFIKILICIISILLMTTNAYASFDISEIANDWLTNTTGREQVDLNESSFVEPVNDLSGMLFGAGVIIVVILTAVLGIRYMLVNPEKKADIQQASIALFIGAVIIFGGLTIWSVLVKSFT